MAEMVVKGVNLGYTAKPYDFTDDATGKQVKGVSQRLHILLGTDVIEVRVPDERVAEAQSLPLKSEVTVKVDYPKSVKPSLVETLKG